ncbi:ATP-binding protein [Streptomyces sp. NPDC101227]|uniref:ATP-binding protein n=1 Tax=Streptomyces sp. NPDC101227 TaxID=3366136 RepID=UPI0037F17EBC
MLDMPEPPHTPVWRIALPHAPAAVSLARALVRTALLDLRAGADGGTAELLAAELVTNAVRHTPCTGPLHLVVERVATGCQVEVHDREAASCAGRCGETVREESAAGNGPGNDAGCGNDLGRSLGEGESGRGLTLVQSLSSAAGCRPTPHGKAVWFTLLA